MNTFNKVKAWSVIAVTAFLLLFYLWALIDKIQHPNYKNLSWKEYIIIGLFIAPLVLLSILNVIQLRKSRNWNNE